MLTENIRFMTGVKGMMLALPMMTAMAVSAQETDRWMPEIHGTVRAKYEYEPSLDAGRFEVRNCRIALTGKVMPAVEYKAEIDLSDEGDIRMLDAYVRLTPVERLTLTAGQMRVPFTIDAHRSPHLQYFANRSFIAKQVGNVRDVGATVGYRFPIPHCPVTVEGGIFNGSGLTDQKDYWTKSYNYSVKASAMIDNVFNLTLGCQHTRPDSVGIMMWNAGAYWHTERWHVEGEYLRKNYSGGAFPGVNAIDAFVCYRLPLSRLFTGISFLGRYDYMDNHSNGKSGTGGQLEVNDSRRHRATAGITLHLGRKALKADVRLNYEKYFYDDGVTPGVSDRDKAVIELMCHF